MLLPGSYQGTRYVGPIGDRGHPACSGGWLGLGGAQARWDCITDAHPSPFLQPSPREVALQILAGLNILVRFEVDCARGADTNVLAPICGAICWRDL